jgi:hypothetical protein
MSVGVGTIQRYGWIEKEWRPVTAQIARSSMYGRRGKSREKKGKKELLKQGGLFV